MPCCSTAVTKFCFVCVNDSKSVVKVCLFSLNIYISLTIMNDQDSLNNHSCVESDSDSDSTQNSIENGRHCVVRVKNTDYEIS